MAVLFDFGISQEDPLTEHNLLNISGGDHILSVASGGEVPLSLLALQHQVHVTAVDLSENQLFLCRLKLLAALHVHFPENGAFLGFAPMPAKKRLSIYEEKIVPHLTEEELNFWNDHIGEIGRGIIGAGRFEKYISKLRALVFVLTGRKNLICLERSICQKEQQQIFHKKIATRKLLKIVFKIAFHPAVYKKRGLQEHALRHAGSDTGLRYFQKFADFCTATPARQNYFLQYFLLGRCLYTESFPPYLLPQHRSVLQQNSGNIQFLQGRFEELLLKFPPKVFNKIHLSNLGDWMDEQEFFALLDKLQQHCKSGTLVCLRILQKDYFEGKEKSNLVFHPEQANKASARDRFPFYKLYQLSFC